MTHRETSFSFTLQTRLQCTAGCLGGRVGSAGPARSDVMFGAFLAGIALMSSGTGPAAAMSYPTGVPFHVPHGLGGAMFLPVVAQHNVREGYFDYEMLLPLGAVAIGELEANFKIPVAVPELVEWLEMSRADATAARATHVKLIHRQG